MENKPKIGTLLTGDEKIDAIHVAIAPVEAGDQLWPGQHVGFSNAGLVVPWEGVKKIGIVDPYLSGPVYTGQKVWLFLYPNTVTSLRHDWEHPSFTKSDIWTTLPKVFDSSKIKESKEWMENLAKSYQHRHPDPYEWLMNEADQVASGEESYIVFSSDCHGEINPQEFWRHYQIIRGKFVDIDTSEDIFSYSC